MQKHSSIPHGKASESRTGLARALSKLGFCSRRNAWSMIQEGRVRLNGVICRDPERPVRLSTDRFDVDGETIRSDRPTYLMLNKPRGLVVTASDERGRSTVFDCLDGKGFLRVNPVGRLDQASEGLLLLTNDNRWAESITNPRSRLEKVYHVQIDAWADIHLLQRMKEGLEVDGEFLNVARVSVLRKGNRNCWLEIVLVEGKNRHLRRLLHALSVQVLRLVRVSIGGLTLGNLAKGQVRELSLRERQQASPSRLPSACRNEYAEMNHRGAMD